MDDRGSKIRQLVIRRARAEDALRLSEIAHDAKRYWGYSEDLMRLWQDDLTITPDFIARYPVYLACSEGEVSGFYALTIEGEIIELAHLWVHPPHMGGDIGRKLFFHALDTARDSGLTTLRIASDPHAEGFYRRMGARLVGRVPSRPEGRELPLLAFDLFAALARAGKESG